MILDEFHERHLHGDIALAYLRDLQKRARPELRLVAMSATLDCGPIAEYLGGVPGDPAPSCRGLRSRSSISRNRPRRRGWSSWSATPSAARSRCGGGSEGDILVFLPGMADIRRAESALGEEFGRELLIAPLHGELSTRRAGSRDLAVAGRPAQGDSFHERGRNFAHDRRGDRR